MLGFTSIHAAGAARYQLVAYMRIEERELEAAGSNELSGRGVTSVQEGSGSRVRAVARKRAPRKRTVGA